jgi:hypothetical protein
VDKAIQTAGPDFGKALKDLEAAVKRVPPFDLILFRACRSTREAGEKGPSDQGAGGQRDQRQDHSRE